MPSACSAFAFDAMLRSRICSYSLSIADAVAAHYRFLNHPLTTREQGPPGSQRPPDSKSKVK